MSREEDWMSGFMRMTFCVAFFGVLSAQGAWVKEEKLWEMNFTPAEMCGLEQNLVMGNSYAPDEGRDGALHCVSTNSCGTRNFSLPLDIARIAGPVLVEARVKGRGIEYGERGSFGPNLMLHYVNPPGSRKRHAWRKLANEYGTFDWKTWTLVDIVPSDAMGLQMVIVLQCCRGEMWVDGLTIWRAKEIPDADVKPPVSNPVADAIPRGRWAGKVRPGSCRGVMSGHDLSEEAFQTLQSWSVNLIRLQIGVRSKDLANGADYFQLLSNRIEACATTLARCQKYGIKVCLDLHSGPSTETTKHSSNFIPADYNTTLLRKAWRMILKRLGGHPAIYAYDILNEPSCSAATWERVFEEVVADIRMIDSKTPVVTESFARYYPPEMNVIYSPHIYAPHCLTHYGVGNQWKIRWSYLNYINGEWWDKERLRVAMKPYIDFSLAHPDARIYVGEFSCIAWVKNAGAYVNDCIELFEEYGWDWTYHAFRECQTWDVEYEAAEPYDTNLMHLRKAAVDTDRKQALLKGLRNNMMSVPTLTVRPQETDEPLVNPGMGLMMYHMAGRLWAYGASLPPGDTMDWFPGVSTVYLRFLWSEIEPEEGVFRWDIVDAIANNWIKAGRQVALRVICCNHTKNATPDFVRKAGAKGTWFQYKKHGVPSDYPLRWEPIYDDAVYLEKYERFLMAFAARYDGNPHVAFVDIGSFGMYGEGHTTGGCNPLDSMETDRLARLHMDIHRRLLPNTYLVISDDVAGAVNQNPDAPLMAYARKLGIGYRDDSIFCCGPDKTPERPEGSWWHSSWAQNFARGSPVVIETGHWAREAALGRWMKDRMVECVESHQASYWAIHGFPREYLEAHRDIIRAINLRIGYRFALIEATWPVVVNMDDPVVIESKWVNRGVSWLHKGASLTWNLLNDDDVICWSSTDPSFNFRTLDPTLDGVAKAQTVRSRCTFGHVEPVLPFDNVTLAVRKFGQNIGENYMMLKPGEYRLAVSVGSRDGRSEIALPLAGGKDRLYPLGKIRVR